MSVEVVNSMSVTAEVGADAAKGIDLGGAGVSANDRAVLQFLFNPAIHSPLQAQQHEKADKSASQEGTEDVEEEEALASMTEEAKKAMQLEEGKAVALAETERLQEADKLLTELVEKHPGVASLLLSRAESRRLAHRFEEALEDASQAVALSRPNGMVKNKKVAKQALAMRGLLLRKGLAEKEGDDGMADLRAAALLGHSLAALEVNPYRTLCGNMVEVMMEEQCGVVRRR